MSSMDLLADRLQSVQGVRRVAPGVVDIVAFDGRGAALAWLLAIAFAVAIGFVVLSGSTDPLSGFSIHKRLGYGSIWGPTGTDAAYLECVTPPGLYDGCRPDLTPSEYYFQVLVPHMYKNGTLFGDVAALLFLSAPFLYLLFWRRRPPVRIDGEKRIVYTWQPGTPFTRGKLYAAPYTTDALVVPGKRKFDAVAGDTLSGAVTLQLFNGQQKRHFKVGPFAAFRNETSAAAAWSAACSVLRPDGAAVSSSLPAQFRLPWWSRTSLLGTRNLPKDIDAKAGRWLEDKNAS